MNSLGDLFSNPLFTTGITSLGIGAIFLVLFTTGKLPTPAERTAAKAELDTVRVNLRSDLEAVKAENAQKDEYIKELVREMMVQQAGVVAINQTMSTLVQQLPVLIFAIEHLTGDKRA